MMVAVFPELDADVLSPNPILKNLIEFTAAVPVPFNLTVPELISAVNVS